MIFTLGDIHGNFSFIIHCLKTKLKDLDNFSIIQVGDYGVGFGKPEQDIHLELNEMLIERHSHLYIIRGNHDNPKYWESDIISYSNIHFVKDHTTLRIDDLNIFFMGGAASVDKQQRLQWMKQYPGESSWWPDEGPNFYYDFDSLRDIDIVITHTAPNFCYPITEGWVIQANEACADERLRFNEISDRIHKNNKVKKWYYGHFHKSNVDIIEGTEYHLLGIGELKQIN